MVVDLESVSLAASVITIFAPGVLVAMVAVDVALVAVAGIDFFLLYLGTNRGIEVTRTIPRTCSLGVPLASEVTIDNRTPMTLVGSIP